MLYFNNRGDRPNAVSSANVQGSGGAVPSTSMDEPDPRTNTDPRSIRAPARIIGNNLMDQGSVAPTSQSQRYYDKILTILSDPRSLATA